MKTLIDVWTTKILQDLGFRWEDYRRHGANPQRREVVETALLTVQDSTRRKDAAIARDFIIKNFGNRDLARQLFTDILYQEEIK